jgi:hypothetical protein
MEGNIDENTIRFLKRVFNEMAADLKKTTTSTKEKRKKRGQIYFLSLFKGDMLRVRYC